MTRLFRGGLERMEMFLLQFRQLPDMMTFAGGEDDEQTGQGRERRNPKTKHAPEE